MRIEVDDLVRDEVRALLTEHLASMADTAPPESRHALDAEQLKEPGVTFWTAWRGDELLGCGALKRLDSSHGEVKSMRTVPAARGAGVASKVLQHILDEARSQGYERVSLETGSHDFFAAARRLYRKHGFVECGPFADYREDPHSVFLTRELSGS